MGIQAANAHQDKVMNSKAVILIASDVVSDAELVRKLLRDEFNNLAISTDPNMAVADFESHHPDVLILAFNSLEKAERYYLGLYRLSDNVHAIPHRTLILCNKDDLKRVYELCKREYFDDYILFWPIPNDALRLPMTVHHALRQITSEAAPTAGQLAAQARRLSELEGLLEHQSVTGGQRAEHASNSVRQAEVEVLAAIDKFYSSLTTGGVEAMVDVRDAAGLEKEFTRLKNAGIAKSFQSVDAAVRPVRQWADSLRSDLAPQLESTRALQKLASKVRPVVLVVEDDEYQHKLLAQILIDENLELVFVTNGAEALSVLRRRRPDLILMDINLPGDDGVEVTRRIKSVEKFADIPVVMITGKGAKTIVIDSLKAGAVDFIVKPFSKNTLATKVRKILAGA